MRKVSFSLVVCLVMSGITFAQGTFTDNFNDGDMAGWIAISNEAWELYPTVESGQCHMSFSSEDENALGMFSPVGAVSEVSFEVKGKSGGAGAYYTGILAISAEGNVLEYHVMEGDTLQLIAGNMVSGDFDVFYEAPVNTSDGNWHTMKIDISGTAPTINITIWWDGVQKHTEQVNDVAEDEAYAHIGFFSYGDNVDMWFDDVSMTYTSITTDVEEVPNIMPKDFALFQNYPNPFNPYTKISYSISKSGFVTLTVYDILGRKIQTLMNEFQKQGEYIVTFDANKLSSGFYFYKLKVGSDLMETKKMLLLQ